MVVFVCSTCNESLKKKSVEKHFNSCRCTSISCVDCSKSFTRQSYSLHTSCISEKEKYDKPNFQATPSKGVSRQMDWTSLVHSRLRDFTAPPGVPTLMKKKILESSNIPRKKAKFQNFLQSSFRFARIQDIETLWQHISKPTNDDSAQHTKNGNADTNKETKESKRPESNESTSAEKENKSGHLTSEESGKISSNAKLEKIYKRFGKLIMAQMKQNSNKMKIKRLRKLTFDTFKKSHFYDENRHSDDFLEKEFQRALHKNGRFVISDDERRVSIALQDE